MSVAGSVPMTVPFTSRLSRHATRDLAHVLADDVVVGDDVAVGGTMTPEPRLSDRRSREPNMSCSPKKYRKNGSFSNGEFWRRTTCSDEMFATPLTAWPAIAREVGTAGRAPSGAGGGALGRGGAARLRFAGAGPAVRRATSGGACACGR